MNWLAWSWSFGRLRGVDFRFHFSILFSIPLAIYLFKPIHPREVALALLWLAGFVACVFLHELGHALAAQLTGVPVKSIVIWLLGGFTTLGRRAGRPSHTLLISAAGPLVNFFLAFVCVVLYLVLSIVFLPYIQNIELFIWTQMFVNLSFSLAVVNLVLAVFNLFPIYPLDGGNITHAVMEIFFGRANADWLTLLIGVPVLGGLMLFAWFTRDYLLIISCVMIGLALVTLKRSVLRWLNLKVNYWFKRAGYYYLLEDFERAAQEHTLAIERDPAQVENYLLRAGCHLQMNQVERATADVERALKLAPSHWMALQLRGELYALAKEYESALDCYDRVQAANPQWSLPCFDRGSVLLEKGEFAPALIELNKSLTMQPVFPLFHVIRSLACYRLGDIEAAHRDQDAALALSDKDALLMVEPNLQVYRSNLDWAEDFYTRVMNAKPDLWLAYLARADAYWVNEQFEKAETDYSHVIRLNPQSERAWLGRGRSRLALGKRNEAESDFRQLLAVTEKLHFRRQAEEWIKRSLDENSVVGD